MERELKHVQQNLKEVEASYGRDMVDLVIVARYVSCLLGSRTVARYLEDNHPEIGREFRVIVSEVLPQTAIANERLDPVA
jgi:hypothetical protein